ncbi:MAG TPA: hypothetical protein VNG33_08585 [Polyangiaceae bacterium]|nr:hypothetical protein [Polyangiaceae bacterium]
MNPTRVGMWLLLTTMLAAPCASAAARTKAPRTSLPTASAASERSTARVLSEALRRQLTDAGLTDSLSGYAISASVTQLRRYIESERLMLVCVVDLSLKDEQGSLVASVRGSATTTGSASPYDAIDSATHAAVARLPQALQALRGNAPNGQMADARRQWEVPLK